MHTMADQKLPPQNIEAEQSLLGALLIDKEAFFKVADLIQGNDFYRDTHGIIFEAMVDLNTRHEPIDILTLGNRLEEIQKLKQVGGRVYLVELSNAVSTAANIINYAHIYSLHKSFNLFFTISFILSSIFNLILLKFSSDKT